MNNINIASLLATATARLSAYSDSPKLDAEILLSRVIQKPRSYLYTWPKYALAKESLTQFEKLIQRRLAGEPIAYITGQQEFWSLTLTITPDTLIPRPETEVLVENALNKIPIDKNHDIVDLGTGSGAIALAIAKERPHTYIIATDKSIAAIEVAKKNSKHLDIKNIIFKTGDWFAPLKNQYFDLIVSNPPYIREDDPHLSIGGLQYEPINALHSGKSGLIDIEKIIIQARNHLKPNGWLLLEHGYDQAAAIIELLNTYNYQGIKCHNDYSQQPRVIEAQVPE